jgi:hypothetical protein
MEDGTITWSGKTEDFRSQFQLERGKGLIHHYLYPSNEKKSVPPVHVSNESSGFDSILDKGDISPAYLDDPVVLIEQEGRVQGAVNPIIYW